MRALRHQLHVDDGVDQHAPPLLLRNIGELGGEGFLRERDIALGDRRRRRPSRRPRSDRAPARRAPRGAALRPASAAGAGAVSCARTANATAADISRAARDGRHGLGHAGHRNSFSDPSRGIGRGHAAHSPALTELWPVLICRGSRSPLPGGVRARQSRRLSDSVPAGSRDGRAGRGPTGRLADQEGTSCWAWAISAVWSSDRPTTGASSAISRWSTEINAPGARDRGAERRRAQGQDRRVPPAARRRHRPRRSSAARPSRRCARPPSARSASAISTSS